MTISQVQKATSSSAARTATTLTWAAPTSGNLVGLIFRAQTLQANITLPAGYVWAAFIDAQANVGIAMKVASGGEGTSVTVSTATSVQQDLAIVELHSDFGNNWIVDLFSTNGPSGTSTSLANPFGGGATAASRVADAVALASVGLNGGSGGFLNTWTNGYVKQGEAARSSWAQKIATATGTFETTETWTTAQARAGAIVVFAPTNIVGASSQRVWAVLAAVAGTDVLRWAVRAAAAAAADLRWADRQAAAAAADLRWAARALAGSPSDLRWADRLAAGAPVVLPWAVAAFAARELAALWGVRAPAAADLSDLWGVRVPASAEAALEWALTERAASDLAAMWATRALAPGDSSLRWSDRDRASGAADLRWGQRRRATSEAPLAWDDLARAAAAAGLPWSDRVAGGHSLELLWRLAGIPLQIRSRVASARRPGRVGSSGPVDRVTSNERGLP